MTSEPEIPAKSDELVQRSVWRVGVLAAVFAAGCGMGVVFGFLHYRYLSARGLGGLQDGAARAAFAGILEKGMLTIAFGHLSRSLFRYAAMLKRQTSAAAALAAAQARCWEACLWVGVLYIGWELTIAFVSSM